MALRRLRAIDPNRLRIIHRDHKFHWSWPRAKRLETGEEAISERDAGGLETALDDGVVFGEVAEGEGVAGLGSDGVGVEGEFAACADSDRNVGGEGKGEEREEGERDGGVHDVDVVVLTCCVWGSNEDFCELVGSKKRETQGNSN